MGLPAKRGDFMIFHSYVKLPWVIHVIIYGRADAIDHGGHPQVVTVALHSQLQLGGRKYVKPSGMNLSSHGT